MYFQNNIYIEIDKYSTANVPLLALSPRTANAISYASNISFINLKTLNSDIFRQRGGIFNDAFLENIYFENCSTFTHLH